jgi:ankyrin repeat protein
MSGNRPRASDRCAAGLTAAALFVMAFTAAAPLDGNAQTNYDSLNKQLEQSRLAEKKRATLKRFLAAARKGDIQALQTELEAGLDINEALDYDSALSVAANGNNIRSLKYLLEGGAQLKPDPLKSEMPLHAAGRSGALGAISPLFHQ